MIGIIVAAFLVRLFFLGGILYLNGEEGIMLSDSRGFLLVAENVLSGHGFSKSTVEPFLPEAHFPPLYPLFMAGSLALTNSLIPLIVFQIILSSLMPLLVFLIAKRFSENNYVATGASALMAFELMSITWSTLILTEVVAIFLLLLAVLFFLRFIEDASSRNAAFAGLFLGLSTLTRPHAQFVFFAMFVFLLFLLMQRWRRNEMFRKQAIGVLIFSTLFFITLSPWLVRNYYQFGTFSIATTGLRNVYSSLGASTLTLHTGRPFPEVREELNEAFAKKHNISVQDIKENPAYGSILADEGFAIIKAHPKEAAEVVVISLMTFFTQDLWLDYLQRFQFIPDFAIDFSPSLVLFTEGPLALARMIWDRLGAAALLPGAGRLLWVAINLLWVIGAFLALRKGGKERFVALFMTLIILFYASSSIVAGFSDQGRFRYPTTAFMFILASYALLRKRASGQPSSEFPLDTRSPLART